MTANHTVVSLYSGAGGMDYGFKLAGFETIFANDIDPTAVETFGRLVGNGVAVAGDINDLTLPNCEDLDVVIGGPPCQGFSVAGNMDPHDARSEHVWKFLEVVSLLEPRVFVMENVKALAVNMRWSGVRQGLLSEANAMGYSTRLFVLKASDFGVAQGRERMFLVGSRVGDPAPPLPTSTETPPTSRSILRLLPEIGQPGNDRLATAAITLASRPILRRSPFAGMLFNGAGRPINLDAPAMTLPASMGGNRTPIVDQLWLEEGGNDHWVKRYHKLLWEGGDPLDWKAAPPCLRRLSTQEAAALQSFPNWLEWAGATSAIFRQVGNAVPPLLAQAVAESVLNLLSPDSMPNRGVQRQGTYIAETLPL
jgi:DNA (cytosine-5)-methyltransferase 1